MEGDKVIKSSLRSSYGMIGLQLVDPAGFKYFDFYILHCPTVEYPLIDRVYDYRESTMANSKYLFRWPVIPGDFFTFSDTCTQLAAFFTMSKENSNGNVRLVGWYAHFLQIWLLRQWGRNNHPQNLKLKQRWCNPNIPLEPGFDIFVLKVRDACFKERKVLNEKFLHKFLEGVNPIFIDQNQEKIKR
ncbi:hypothetical protein O6H91_01G039200 [Diphasiastrum complanatum]|uniref:Uncharacterized protein n=1 Tax=Diphasiastrum complanatum TaxID=34168 RepID=A0ACC2EQ13_DIPCM|nr:hypothetical protein O6H91_Y467800 [Diphasiastrum complanatum]KAJ7568584.1 hypothetical protein O6H91_01G039200 [Diphasiastrum complanatum]